MTDRIRRAEDEAKKRGMRIVYPRAHELFIDIDCAADMCEFTRRWPQLVERMPGARYDVRPSPSGRKGKAHIYVSLPQSVDELTRIVLQACLGSDRQREILSWSALQLGETRPTLFFEKPDV